MDSSLEELPDDMLGVLLGRLTLKQTAKLCIVRRGWNRVIGDRGYQLMLPARLEFEGTLESDEEVEVLFCRIVRRNVGQPPYASRIRWLSADTLQLNGESTKIVDVANGVMLFFDKGTLRFQVINNEIKQIVKIEGAPPEISQWDGNLTVLHFDPFHSRHIQICYFLDHGREVVIYSSKSRSWVQCALPSFNLDNDIIWQAQAQARWVRQWVSLRASVYLFSLSGHLLKFTIHGPTERIVTEAVRVPPTTQLHKIDANGVVLGHCNGHLLMALLERRLRLTIWSLNDGAWQLKYKSEPEGMENLIGKPTACKHFDSTLLFLHPNQPDGLLFVTCSRKCGERGNNMHCIQLSKLLIDSRVKVFPYLHCPIPFVG